MRLARAYAFAVVALAASMLVVRAGAQSAPLPATVAGQPATAPFRVSFGPAGKVPLTSISVPYDQAEPVTGGAQLITSPEQRAQILQLLQNARMHSDLRLHPYDLKTSFTSYGSSSSDGRWILEDISPGRNIYRWTAQGPSFNGVFLSVNKLLWSNQAGGAMPLRLAQVRIAMWAQYYPGIGPFAALRVATGNLNGAEARCVLAARGVSGRAQRQFPDGRSFADSEYCIDPETGLLASYSPYPGVYIRYDYSNAIHFHQLIIPNGFTILENRQTVIEARTDSVTDPPTKTSNLFDTSGLNALGVGQVIVPPRIVHGYQSSLRLGSGSAPQAVALHGMLAPDGQLTELEILASTNPALNDGAIRHARRAPSSRMPSQTQPGNTPRSRETVFIVEFVPSQTAATLGAAPAN